MDDRAIALLELYDIEIIKTAKGRAAFLCDTNKGCLIFKEYFGNEYRLSMQDKLLKHIEKVGVIPAESLIPNKEGQLFVKDADGTKYILKTYSEGRECNIRDRDECLAAVKQLAGLHQSMYIPYNECEAFEYSYFSPAREYEKRNRELKRVQKYLMKKRQKTDFERDLLNQFSFFLDQALCVEEEWKYYENLLPMGDEQNKPKDGVTFCHGDYQYHNLLWRNDGWNIINFEKCIVDDQIRDLHLWMRKILEKNDWLVSLGKDLLETYIKERNISAASFIDLYYRLSYPEKFWKIVNYYYNSGKSRIPEKNQEKLSKLAGQEKDKQIFLDEVFKKYYLK